MRRQYSDRSNFARTRRFKSLGRSNAQVPEVLLNARCRHAMAGFRGIRRLPRCTAFNRFSASFIVPAKSAQVLHTAPPSAQYSVFSDAIKEASTSTLHRFQRVILRSLCIVASRLSTSHCTAFNKPAETFAKFGRLSISGKSPSTDCLEMPTKYLHCTAFNVLQGNREYLPFIAFYTYTAPLSTSPGRRKESGQPEGHPL
jgi:uncharacterized membrane protein